MPNEKQFDVTTIAIIIISIILILGGFYLLNQSFTKKQEISKPTVSINSNSNVAQLPNTPISSKDTISSQSSENKSSQISNSSSSSTDSSSSSTSSSITFSSSSSKDNTKESVLSQSEAVAKVISEEGGLYKIEIVDTGYKNGRLWKIGKQFKINSTAKLTQGKEYKFSDITEADGTTTIGLIKENK